MYRSDNDRSINAQENNIHKYYSNKITNNKLQYVMHRLYTYNV